MNRKEYQNNCFSPNWIEINMDEVERQAEMEAVQASEGQLAKKEVNNNNSKACPYNIKEDRLESKRRKDLNTLLKELEEIKQNIEKAAEKQHRLTNLMSFYTGEFAQ